MERVPRRRQTCRSTRRSVSESSQRTMPPVRRQAPENPEFGSSRAPVSGATVPAEARQTMAFPSASAIATPSAPVSVRARSATSCSTSSRTNCSSSQTSAGSSCVAAGFAGRDAGVSAHEDWRRQAELAELHDRAHGSADEAAVQRRKPESILFSGGIGVCGFGLDSRSVSRIPEQ